MLATRATTRMELFLPSIVQFHDVPSTTASARMNYAPALSFHQQATAQQALEALRQMQPDVDHIYYLFVTDSSERLVGVVSLRDLICAAPGARLFEFMDRRVIAVPHNASLTEQANLMSESGLLALPIVDEHGHLVGAMDANDLIRAMQEESTTDMYYLAGIDRTEMPGKFSATIASYRTVWLGLTLVVALIAAWLISGFQGVFAHLGLIVAFAPLIVLQGLQAGKQTLALVTRSLALGHAHVGDERKLLHREVVAALGNGLMIGGLSCGLIWLWQGSVIPGLIVGLSVLLTLLLAAIVGVWVPMARKAHGLNPTQASALIVGAVTTLGGLGCLFGLAGLAVQAGYL